MIEIQTEIKCPSCHDLFEIGHEEGPEKEGEKCRFCLFFEDDGQPEF